MSIFSRTDDTAKERERWTQLSEIVTAGLRNFQRLGPALKEIRDRELYKFEFTTFELCCQVKWQITVRHANRLIAAYETAEEIGPAGSVALTERQLRPLAGLPTEEKQAAFAEAAAQGATPAAIAKAAAKRRPKRRVTPALKPLRLKVPGGVIVIQPNRKARSYDELWTHGSQKLQQLADRSAAA